MSNFFPPILSTSPPPIDARDEEEDENFCDFRVADFSLDFSGPSNDSGSVGTGDSPTTADSPIPIPQSPVHSTTAEAIPVEESSVVLNENDLVEDNYKESKGDEEGIFPAEGEYNSTELEESESEIKSIPFPPVFNPSISLPENELRTSPEGADSDDICTDESFGYSWNKMSSHDNFDLGSNVTDDGSGLPSHEKTGTELIEESAELKSVDDFGDFADFSSHDKIAVDSIAFSPTIGLVTSPTIRTEETTLHSVLPVVECEEDNAEVQNEGRDNLDDDFDDFESAPPRCGMEPDDDDFDDFESAPPRCGMEPDDNDFDDFESATTFPQTFKTEEKVLTEKISSLFPGSTSEPESDPRVTGCLSNCLDDSSSVWGHLKDLEASHALKLQWSTSAASFKLLSSLNIDSRNILIGSRWNVNVPRFAANLSCAPLEPVKAEATLSLTPSLSVTASSITEDVVPVAQFDWTSSGLTNPLDSSTSSLLGLDFLIDNLASSSHAASSVWTPTNSAQKAENTVRDTSETIAESAMVVDEIFSDPQIPSVDVLLSTPMDPHAAIELDSVLVKHLSNSENDSVMMSERWLSEPKMSDSSKENVLDASSWTITSQLESKRVSVTPKLQQLSPEACRVVETLPDLSFLSARKLLYTANENLGRFHSKPRL